MEVPPASLSSIAAKEGATGGPAVEALLKEPQEQSSGGSGAEVSSASASASVAQAPSATGGGILSGVVAGVESFVGMDEP